MKRLLFLGAAVAALTLPAHAGSPLERFGHNLRDARSAKERWYDDFAVATDVLQVCEERHLTVNRGIVKQKYKDLHLDPADQVPDGADWDLMSRAQQRADHATEGLTASQMCELGDDLFGPNGKSIPNLLVIDDH